MSLLMRHYITLAYRVLNFPLVLYVLEWESLPYTTSCHYLYQTSEIDNCNLLLFCQLWFERSC